MKQSKRIAVIGRGTAGALAVTTLYKNYSNQNFEIQWHFDSTVQTQAVGEGSTLAIPSALFKNIEFRHQDLDLIDGTFKYGIRKLNWSKDNLDFIHEFPPPGVSYHFNAISLQNFIFNQLKDKVILFDQNINSDRIDADYVIDCSGKPKDFTDFHEPEYIPINAAYVTQCYWDSPKFFYTLAIARPYGWVFGIPLKNRCSIGYMFNDQITNIDHIKNDVKEIFNQFQLTPSSTTNEIHFRNYFKKNNFTKRVSFNGNASFFLEPLEATTLTGVNMINEWSCKIIDNPLLVSQKNHWYKIRNINTERMLMLHYFSGSIFKTDFWEYAQERAVRCLKEAFKDPQWSQAYEISKNVNFSEHSQKSVLFSEASPVQAQTDDWGMWSYYSNLSNRGLNIYKNLDQLRES